MPPLLVYEARRGLRPPRRSTLPRRAAPLRHAAPAAAPGRPTPPRRVSPPRHAAPVAVQDRPTLPCHSVRHAGPPHRRAASATASLRPAMPLRPRRAAPSYHTSPPAETPLSTAASSRPTPSGHFGRRAAPPRHAASAIAPSTPQHWAQICGLRRAERQCIFASPLSSEHKMEISHDKGSDISDPNVVGQNDLLIVGPGVLGRIVAQKWQKEHPSCKVYGQTASKNHHNELTDLGIIPSLKGTTIHQKVPHVIFCAPPSGSDDYPGDVRLAGSNWSGEGSFLFTSSTALYDCSDNSMCNEDCPSVPFGRSPRTDVLLKVENVVLESGGCVLRLAGLYKIDRGAHVFWLRKGTLDTRPDHIINQIHYEDAASLAIAIMKKRLRSQILLGCDNKPLSRQEIMDAVNRSGKFDTKFEGFTGTDGPLGKRMENSKTRAEIGWEPKYPSFTEFLGISS